MKTNGGMHQVGRTVMYEDVYEAVDWAVDWAVDLDLDGAVYWAAFRAVDGTMDWAVRDDPPHRDLLDFLAARRTP